MLKVGLIGNGGIARTCRKALAEQAGGRAEITAILVRAGCSDDEDLPLVDSLEALIASRPDVIAECAGHGAVRAFGTAVLEAGIPLVVVSVGALADADLHARLLSAEAAGGSRMILPSGAIGGLDALHAAQLGGLDEVRYRGRKPALAWTGTPAESQFALHALTEPTVIFRGNAREAALTYPKNSNVAAAVALAGLGFDDTTVELIADPLSQRNVHEISFTGRDGMCRIEIEGNPSPDNPKTSMLTAHSLASTLLNLLPGRSAT
jgi:aspartate dehydrogenase